MANKVFDALWSNLFSVGYSFPKKQIDCWFASGPSAVEENCEFWPLAMSEELSFTTSRWNSTPTHMLHALYLEAVLASKNTGLAESLMLWSACIWENINLISIGICVPKKPLYSHCLGFIPMFLFASITGEWLNYIFGFGFRQRTQNRWFSKIFLPGKLRDFANSK